MKKFLLVACLLIPNLAAAQSYPPGPPPQAYGDYPHDHFQHHKFDEMHDIDVQIAALRNKRDCVAAAGNYGMLHACNEPGPGIGAPPIR